jgi:Copper type II ascorbate-dependent monooxygenase, C-terminal domain
MRTSTIVLSGSSVRLSKVCASFALIASFAGPALAADGVKKSDVTYTKDVSRIVEERCQTCHHKGTAAPFSLLTFEDAKNKANRIREAVTANRMPPWHADPNHGKFSNDRRLSDDQKQKLLAWIEGGCVEGDKKDLPEPKTYADGWVIGKPDIVFELPKEQTIKAEGVEAYQYFVTPTNFKEDVWVQAAEARPGNRAVVHHIIVFFRDPKNPQRGGGDGLGQNMIVGTAPGDMPQIFKPGVARRIPAGSQLVFQMHYTPTGKEEKDRSQVGFIFYKGKEPPAHAAVTQGIANMDLRIPPGAANQKFESNLTLRQNVVLFSFMPHMHVRGKDFEYEAIYPDGRKEVLLSVPKFDFNWQTMYRLETPVKLPKGTRIHCTAHYDNSDKNPANPDPTKEVSWGDQTWEEMLIGWVDYYLDTPDKGAKTTPTKVEGLEEQAEEVNSFPNDYERRA